MAYNQSTKDENIREGYGTPAGQHTHPELGQGDMVFLHTTVNTGIKLHGKFHQKLSSAEKNRKAQVRDRFGVNLTGNQPGDKT